MALKLNVDTSVEDWMKANGQDGSYANRAKLAKQYGIQNYQGTAQQNKKLWDFLKTENSKNTAAAAMKANMEERSKKNANKGSKPKAPSPTTTNTTTDNSFSSQYAANLGNNSFNGDVKSLYEGVLKNAGEAPTYSSNWQSTLDSLLGQILTRPDFSYDQSNDALYQQYKDQYTANGNKAMRDTMGNAAALTGGYGSSYATTAGSQAYDSYMEGLNDKGLELYDRAYQKYQDEGNWLLNQYGTTASAEDSEYQKFLNQYDQWKFGLNTQMGIADATVNQYNSDRDFANLYDNYLEDLKQNEIRKQQWDTEFKYNEQRDTVNDEHWNKEFEHGVKMDNEQLALNKAKQTSSGGSAGRSSAGGGGTAKAKVNYPISGKDAISYIKSWQQDNFISEDDTDSVNGLIEYIDYLSDYVDPQELAAACSALGITGLLQKRNSNKSTGNSKGGGRSGNLPVSLH